SVLQRQFGRKCKKPGVSLWVSSPLNTSFAAFWLKDPPDIMAERRQFDRRAVKVGASPRQLQFIENQHASRQRPAPLFLREIEHAEQLFTASLANESQHVACAVEEPYRAMCQRRMALAQGKNRAVT